jgi:hypothetical protein
MQSAAMPFPNFAPQFTNPAALHAFGKDLQGNKAVQTSVFRLIHHTHTSALEFLNDVIV